MAATHGGDGPDEGPSIRMKHGQHPQVAIRTGDMGVHQVAHDVEGRVAMRNHDAFGIGRGTTGIIQRDHLRIRDFGGGELGRGSCQHGLVTVSYTHLDVYKRQVERACYPALRSVFVFGSSYPQC